MLKFSPIKKKNGAHLVEKKDVFKKKTVYSQGLNVSNMQKHF